MPYLKELSYPERLKILNLPTIAYRRIRGDMIEVFKIIKGIFDKEASSILKMRSDMAPKEARGLGMKHFLQKSSKLIRQKAFGVRIVTACNSLPDNVVNSPNVNTFKARLDWHWEKQEIRYNYRANLDTTRTASDRNRVEDEEDKKNEE